MRRCKTASVFPARFTIAFALLLGAPAAPAIAAPIPHGTLELSAEDSWITPGHDFSLGLHFQLEKGWHIYWINPGDSGEPPRVTWRLPNRLTAAPIRWPVPRRLGTSSIVDFGYEDDVMLLVPMHADASLAGKTPVQIAAEVKLLVCRELCIPGKAQLSLTLPVKLEAPVRDVRTRDLFAAARKSLPRPAPANWSFRVDDTKDSFELIANGGSHIASAAFFPLAESQIDNAAPQKVVPGPAGFRLTMRKSDQLLKPIQHLNGVLVLSADRAYVINAPVGEHVAAGASAPGRVSSH
jgi:DsbC/DsbD-like thiol-disulfide interchange protein